MVHTAQGTCWESTQRHHLVIVEQGSARLPKGQEFHSQQIKKPNPGALVSRNWWQMRNGQNMPWACVYKEEKRGKLSFVFAIIKEHFASFLLVSSYSCSPLAQGILRITQGLTHSNTSISTLSTYTAPVVVKVLYKSLWVLTTPLWGRWVLLSPFSRWGNWGREVKWLAQGCTGSWTRVLVAQLWSPLRRGNTDELPGLSWCQPNNPTLIPQALCPLLWPTDHPQPSEMLPGVQQELDRVCNLKATCPRAPQRAGHTQTSLQRVSRQLQLCFGANSLLPQPRAKLGLHQHEISTQTFHLLLFLAKMPLQISPRSGHLRHGSFHSLSLSLRVCVSTQK